MSELSADAYEATVPTQLSGFRGTSPIALALAGAIVLAIVLVSLLAFFHRSGPNANAYRAAAVAPAQPAAPGIGGTAVETAFIPEATAEPAAAAPTAIPFLHVPIPLPTAAGLARSVQSYIPAEVSRSVPALAVNANAADDRMQIDQPKANAGASQDAQAAADIGQADRYAPVYPDGHVASTVPALETSAQGPAQAQAAMTGGPSATGSSQFVSDRGLGAGNTGLLEARRYSAETANQNLGYVRPQTVRQLAAASVINARLLTKIESDLPGPVLAQVTQPVYDSATHSVVVIPAGSRVFGRYDEETVASSRRLLMSFDRLIFPDGEEFDIGGQPGTDSQGSAGFAGDVDTHRGSLYTSALLLTVLAGAESAVAPQTSLYGSTSIGTQIQSAAGAQLSQLSNKILNNAIDRPATIIIRPPYAFAIIVTRDLPLDEYAAEHR